MALVITQLYTIIGSKEVWKYILQQVLLSNRYIANWAIIISGGGELQSMKSNQCNNQPERLCITSSGIYIVFNLDKKQLRKQQVQL